MCGSDFCTKKIVQKFLENYKKLFVSFMDLEQAFDRVDRKGLWDVFKMCGLMFAWRD